VLPCELGAVGIGLAKRLSVRIDRAIWMVVSKGLVG
jgi:hypothetical protein